MHSETRRLVLDESEYAYRDTGWKGWVFWVDASLAPQDTFAEYWGAGRFLGLYPVKDQIGVFVGGPVAKVKPMGLREFSNYVAVPLEIPQRLHMPGAFPTPPQRLHWVKELLPLSVFEASHFLGSLVGVALLVLARGLSRRLDSAYWAAIAMLGLGIVVLVLRGFDFEEATVLLIVLLALLPCRRHFYRKGSLLRPQFGVGWAVGVGLVLICSAWLGLFSFKHVEHSHDLWWLVALRDDAPRFLRASVGAVGLALAIGLWQLLRPARPRVNPPSLTDLEAARQIAEASGDTYAQLVLLGDKRLLFNDGRTAFVMFAVQGRSWVAMGDPVGPPAEAQQLILRLRELADAYDDWAVFYQVDGEGRKRGRVQFIVPWAAPACSSGHPQNLAILAQIVNNWTRPRFLSFLVRFEGVPAGPPLTGLYGRTVALSGGKFAVADDAYIRRALLDPKAEVRAGYAALMPSYDGKIEPEQVIEIAAYLRSIADASGPLAGPGIESSEAIEKGNQQ